MPITQQNLLAHEWIGLEVSVRASPDPGVTGLLGTVRDETRNTFLIEARNRLVSVPKSKAQFVATLPTGEIVCVDGRLLRHRPEDRVKKGLVKW
jgi:ribonuclease P protein subunit POP4